jgi:hypothetical protein
VGGARAAAPSQSAQDDTKVFLVPMNMQTLQLIQEHIPQDITVASEYTYSEADKLEDVNDFE